MKKLFVLTLVLVLLAGMAIPALAAGPGRAGGPAKGGKAPFALSGVITGIDPSAGTVTVTVACGNTLVKPYIDQPLNLQTTDTTRILLRNPDSKATQITFNQLEVGQYVSVQGRLVKNVWTATRLTVGAKLTCLP
jgi:hypothetical protein